MTRVTCSEAKQHKYRTPYSAKNQQANAKSLPWKRTDVINRFNTRIWPSIKDLI